MARPLRGGGKSLATKKKKLFFEALKEYSGKKFVATKRKGGGRVKASVAGPLLLAASLSKDQI